MRKVKGLSHRRWLARSNGHFTEPWEEGITAVQKPGFLEKPGFWGPSAEVIS
jgi:hypothetical protein